MNAKFCQMIGMGLVSIALPAIGAPLISLGDPVIALDENFASNSSYPGAEGPAMLIDGNVTTKYLNFGKANAGIIVTPTGGASVARSFVMTTANDAEERDPAQIAIYGTNQPIVSLDNSDGEGEVWTLISAGDVTLPVGRGLATVPMNFANETAYTSYRVLFPALKGGTANSVQLAEFQMWDGDDATGAAIMTPTSPVIAVHQGAFESSYPALEGPANLFDGDTATKYLNFGIENSGFIVTPSSGPSVATSFIVSTANDFEGRDPASWEIFGTNAAIVSAENSDGRAETWTPIASGIMDLPIERFAEGQEVHFANASLYTSYKWIVRTVRTPGGDSVDSTQYSEFQLFSGGTGGEIRITSISRNPSGNSVELTWEAPANGLYTLQSSSNLNDWSNVIANDLTVEENSTYSFSAPETNLFLRFVPTPTL